MGESHAKYNHNFVSPASLYIAAKTGHMFPEFVHSILINRNRKKKWKRNQQKLEQCPFTILKIKGLISENQKAGLASYTLTGMILNWDRMYDFQCMFLCNISNI